LSTRLFYHNVEDVVLITLRNLDFVREARTSIYIYMYIYNLTDLTYQSSTGNGGK